MPHGISLDFCVMRRVRLGAGNPKGSFLHYLTVSTDVLAM